MKKKGAEGAGLLPSPLQLAKIAAAIGFHSSDNAEWNGRKMEAAIQNAVSLYLRAMRFHKEHQHDSLEELTIAVDSDLHVDVALSKFAEKNPALRLEMDKATDTARRFLKKEGLLLRKAKSVLENLLEYAQQTEMREFLQSKGQNRTLAKGMTQKEHDEQIKRTATAAGWDQEAWMKHGYQIVQVKAGKKVKVLSKYHPNGFRELRADDREVYKLSAGLLSGLVEWKKARKHSGGLKSRETEAAKIKSSQSSEIS
jgi:hypothetical protein